MKQTLKLFILLFFLFSTFQLKAQNKFRDNFKDKLYAGGTIGLAFGSITRIEVSPIIGYKLTERFSAGLGFTYAYLRAAPLSQTIYGGKVFSRYFFTDNIFAHAEIEPLSVNITDDLAAESKTVGVTNVWLGGGYMQGIGKNSGAFILFLYNVNQTSDSPYPNPEIRGGFTFGI